jgi:hypothetical protein
VTTPKDSQQPHDEVTDEELDAALAAGDAKLMDYVRTYADPIPTLTVLLANTGDEGSQPDPAHPEDMVPSGTSSRTDAMELIMHRMHLRKLVRMLERLTGGGINHQLDDAIKSFLGRRGFPSFFTELDVALQAVCLALPYDGAVSRDFARDLDAVRDEALNAARALDLAPDVGCGVVPVACAHEQAYELGRALKLASALVLNFEPEHDRELRSALGEAVAHARALDRHLEDALSIALIRYREDSAQQIIASGADLFGLPVQAREVLVGVVWDDDTRWAPGLREHVAARSTEIAPGLYRITPDSTERDTHKIVSM